MHEYQGQAKRSITIGAYESNVVQRLADEKGLSFSSALRMIVREWEATNVWNPPTRELRPHQTAGRLT